MNRKKGREEIYESNLNFGNKKKINSTYRVSAQGQCHVTSRRCRLLDDPDTPRTPVTLLLV